MRLDFKGQGQICFDLVFFIGNYVVTLDQETDPAARDTYVIGNEHFCCQNLNCVNVNQQPKLIDDPWVETQLINWAENDHTQLYEAHS